jgi:hypothetical protein
MTGDDLRSAALRGLERDLGPDIEITDPHALAVIASVLIAHERDEEPDTAPAPRTSLDRRQANSGGDADGSPTG